MKLCNIFLTVCATVLTVNAAAVTETPLNPSLPTSYAIIVDNDTYQAAKASVLRYREAVESDGLATYIISDAWQNPDDVREAIKGLYASDPRLEGVVLVGDIPVAMVRNAQHMTTAFKMDEKVFPPVESSVPSDRFYDDFDLEFRYLYQDSVRPNLFYYELDENAAQTLSPDIYSARIRYPDLRGGDRHAAIAAFLDKAARAKAEMRNDRLDNVVSFNGHGYNSDCLIAWIDAEKAYRESFPAAFGSRSGFKHLNFRMEPQMKFTLFRELQRPGIDLFMFHEHGGPTMQYINGGAAGNNETSRINGIKSSVYAKLKRAMQRGGDRNEIIAGLCKDYNLNEAFFKEFDDPAYWEKDSIDWVNINIFAEELHDRTTNPRFVMFDACYNGSFHDDDYIAGEYLFNDGNTIVTQGNTRNVLQDRWTIEMIGLLSHGLRAGHYNRMAATLEGHLMGDPTMRFAPIEANDVAQNVTLSKNDVSYWRKLLASPYADMQMLAMRMLADNDSQRTMSPELLEIYRTSPYNTVRMEAVKLLSRYNNGDFLEAVRLGIDDPYELVARLSCDYAGNIGDSSLVEPLVKAFISNGERQRVRRTAGTSLVLFDIDRVEEAIGSFFADNDRLADDEEVTRMAEWVNHQRDYIGRTIDDIANKELKERSRLQSIRTVRNNPYHRHVDMFMAVVADSSESEEVRVVMCEALGWFVHSVRRADIIDFCRKLAQDSAVPATLRSELIQTANRLS